MKRAAGVWALIAAIGIAGGACGESATAPERSAGSSAKSARGFFPITPWEIQKKKQKYFEQPGHGIASLRRCGFNTVAFVRPDQIDQVEKAGMRAIVGRPGKRVNWRKMSSRVIERYVTNIVEAAGESDAVLGYFIADEPSARDFPALRKAVAAVKQQAPGKLAYINVFPNYAKAGGKSSQLGTKSYAAYLRRYVAIVRPQFISYDNYSVEYSMNMRARARAASYYTNLLQVRRVARRHGLPFWNALSSNRIRPRTTAPSPASLRFQAYTSLAAGTRGISWFTYYAGRYTNAPIGKSGRRTATWSYLRKVNRQVAALAPILVRLRSTGVYFTRPAPVSGLPLLPGKMVRSVTSPTAVMVGELSGGGRRFAMVVNLSLRRSAKIVVEARLGKGGVLRLAPGKGALLRLDSRVSG
jgi:hypothetical protein